MMTLNELLQQSRKQAERATPLVRAAAKMRIARLESATDRPRARITLEMALEDIRNLPEPERGALLEHARIFAAAVDPSLLPGIPEELIGPPGHRGWVLGKTMLEHGHAEAALQFVLQDRPAEEFPFLFAGNILHERGDRDERSAVMQKAAEAWRQTRERDFVRLFGAHWTELPGPEALEVLHSIVESTMNQPEWPMQGSFDEGSLLFTSGRAFTLFEVLHVLRRLDPSLAEQLVADHEQLGLGARRYPNGWDSIRQEAEEKQRRQVLEGGAVCGGRGYIGSGISRDVAFQFALQDGDLEQALEFAQEVYREDTDTEAPNLAPKVLWPSAARFRSVLYQAGKTSGFERQDLLTRVSDKDLQLLANVEFAAAVAGLPPMHDSSRRQSRAQHGRLGAGIRPLSEADGPVMVVDGAPVRCPACEWRPRTGSVWGCRCGHIWNTFTSKGRCPACSYQWTVTQCMRCVKMSPHEDWYGPKEA